MRRRWIFWLIICGAIWFAVSRLTEIEKLIVALRQGQWQWVGLALLLQCGYFATQTSLYRSSLTAAGIKIKFRDLFPVVLGSLFVNILAPTGGAAGLALFVDDAHQRGYSSGRAAAGMILAWVADYIMFGLVIAIGFAFLFRTHQLSSYEVAAAALLFISIIALGGSLLLAHWYKALLRRILNWFEWLISLLGTIFRFKHLLKEGWADKTTSEFVEASGIIAAHPKSLKIIFGWALWLNLVGVLTLWSLFLAFHVTASFGLVVAVYSIIILFVIISPTPQGIGIVEGIALIVLSQVGVSGADGAAIVLAFRGISLWLPLLIGFFYLRKVKSFRAKAQSESISEVWGVRLAAFLTAVVGIGDLISAALPAASWRFQILNEYSPLDVRIGARYAAIFSGFGLLILSQGLWRRKRNAWYLTLALLLISFFSHIIKGLDFEEAGVTALLAIWLLTMQPHFHAQSDRPSILHGFKVLVIAFLTTLIYGVAGFYFLDRHFSVNFDFLPALRQTVFMFTRFTNPGLEPITGFGRYFADSIYVVGAATLGYALLMLIRPVLLRRSATLAERRRAQKIVQEYGRSSLAQFALLSDKSYFFSSGGSVFAYVVKGTNALVLGDPIGPQIDFSKSITEFVNYCGKNGWRAAFYQVQPEEVKQYKELDFSVLEIGSEAIVNLADFTLEGGENKPLRSPYNSLNNQGYSAEMYLPPVPFAVIDEADIISEEWLTSMHGAEKRFSLGWFDRDYIRDNPIMIIKSPEGVIIAFATIINHYNDGEAVIDLMRRRPEVQNGTMEFMMVSLILWAKENGFKRFNLGLSPLAGVGEEKHDPAVEKAVNFIYRHINSFYNFQGLRRFKEKFHPDWSPRYLVCPSTASMPSVTLAVIRADAGDNFWLEYIREMIK